MNQKVNESHYQQLREQSWRRKLTAKEEESLQAYFLIQPEAQADWETETSLNQHLSQLPDAPVASNFTALVMQAIDREVHAAARAEEELPRLWHWLRRWAPRAAWASLVLGGVFLAYAQYQSFTRSRLARSVAQVSAMTAPRNWQMFEDFEAIHRIGQVTPDDAEVLAALQ
jgi:hypothetical protein